jgi:AraC family transcriptional regulator
MRSSLPSVNRFFICSQYAIYYRRVKKLDWVHEARADYAVLLLLAGSVTFSIGDTAGALSHDQSLLIGPSVRAKATGQAVELILLTLAPAYVVDHAVRMGLIGPAAAVSFRPGLLERDDRLAQLARSLAGEIKSEEPGREIVLGALVDQVAVQLLRQYSAMRRSEELELSRVGLIDRRIRRSVELMHAQLEYDLSLKEIAAASYLSPFHFARLFKKLTGTTPHAYLASIRNTRAQLLLGEPNLSVTEISSRVGYASPSHFTKAFRQATGLTPRAFRKALISL